jgi:hypothetical protein
MISIERVFWSQVYCDSTRIQVIVNFHRTEIQKRLHFQVLCYYIHFLNKHLSFFCLLSFDSFVPNHIYLYVFTHCVKNLLTKLLLNCLETSYQNFYFEAFLILLAIEWYSYLLAQSFILFSLLI